MEERCGRQAEMKTIETLPQTLIRHKGKIIGVTDFYHRVPNWMTIEAHLFFEKIIRRLLGRFIKNRILGSTFNLFHGIICAYSIREITAYNQRQIIRFRNQNEREPT